MEDTVITLKIKVHTFLVSSTIKKMTPYRAISVIIDHYLKNRFPKLRFNFLKHNPLHVAHFNQCDSGKFYRTN